MDNERAKLLQELYEAIDKKDEENIRNLKRKNLIHGSNLFDVIINYLMLCYAGIDVDFGCKILKKGTKLYRIRRYIEGVDFSDPSQWNYPPHKPENRANREGEPALYLGSSETVCLLETHISKEECYCLGEYVVQEDIELGGFLDVEDRNSTTWILIGVILNAFLISPARGDKTTVYLII